MSHKITKALLASSLGDQDYATVNADKKRRQSAKKAPQQQRKKSAKIRTLKKASLTSKVEGRKDFIAEARASNKKVDFTKKNLKVLRLKSGQKPEKILSLLGSL